MKKYVIFSLKNDEYVSQKYSSDEMSILDMFLTEDYPLYKFNRLIQWARKSEPHFTNANLTFFEQELGRVVIGDLYDTEFPRTTFSLPVKKFVKLLQDWEKAASSRPKHITITRENDTVTVKGHD